MIDQYNPCIRRCTATADSSGLFFSSQNPMDVLLTVSQLMTYSRCWEAKNEPERDLEILQVFPSRFVPNMSA